MKANLPFLRDLNSFSLLGLLSLFIVSCGSYQNTSYYDNDGVYSSAERENTPVENKYSEQNMEKGNEYASQFKNMQNEYDYFTDVENYSSNNQDTVVVIENNSGYSRDYAGWGNNDHNVTINYYDNNWGYNNWGWNSWYGNNWGYNNWYSPYGVYYGNPYAYNGWNWGWNLGWNSWYGNSWGWNSWYGNNWYGIIGVAIIMDMDTTEEVEM